MCTAPEAVAEEEEKRSRGISRYIKRRKLEPLETYVPAVIAAQRQLEAAGKIMRADLTEARNLLRNGPFLGLRDNIRAVGQYADTSNEGSKLSQQFLSAVEKFDFVLFDAKRNGKPLGSDADEALEKADVAINRLLRTVPTSVLLSSQKVIEEIEPDQGKAGGSMSSDPQINQLLQLVPS